MSNDLNLTEDVIANADVDDTNVDISEIASIVEALLFAANKPMTITDLQKILIADQVPAKPIIKEALNILQKNYQERAGGAIELVEVASGYRFQVKSRWASWVARLWQEKPPRYSRALLEVLALVAYRQPVTRGDIEAIRGVAVSSSIIKILEEERGWIKVIGQREVPGRPNLYATTKEFLDYFNLISLKDLPPLTELMGPDPEQDTQKTIGQEIVAAEATEEVSEATEITETEEITGDLTPTLP